MTNAENNPIGFLQEICQKYSLRFPEYEEVNCTGPDHCREFTFKCKFEGFEALGLSRQKKQAKSEAAKAMIALLKENNYNDKIKLESGLSNNINHVAEVGATSENDTFSVSKNPISALNEFCQKNSLPPPQFVETSTAGVFICECKLEDKKTYGQGINKKTAKTEAALKMCIAFDMKCNGYLLKESPVEEDFIIEKNPVSALQELCAQNPSLKPPEYAELPPLMNLFGVKCTYNSISCEGRGTSKKSAKTEAARQVVVKLLAQSGNSDGHVPAVAALSKVLTLGSRSTISPSGLPVQSELQDFNVDSSEEEEEDKKEDLSTAVDVNLNLKLEALSIQAEHKLNDVSESKPEETNQAQEPGESGNLN